MTNFEARVIALSGAWSSKSPEVLAKIYSDLACTERNFVLRKGETTVTLRRDEVDQAHLERLAGSLIQMIKDKVELRQEKSPAA